MTKKSQSFSFGWMHIAVLVLFISVVIVNALAVSLPINNVSTGEISDAYPNLFTPAGSTFSIWGVIYFLLAGFSIYQLQLFSKKKFKNPALLNQVRKYFAINCVANISWIISWHYFAIGLSLFWMLLLLFTLIKITDLLKPEKLNFAQSLWLRLPFSVYFGWITVATIANITALLVSISWGGWGIPEEIWAVLILSVGAGIGIWRGLKDASIAYLLVFVWAYFGIYSKHISPTDFAGAYQSVIATTQAAMVAFVGVIGYLARKNLRKT